jgi:hypothetical protein
MNAAEYVSRLRSRQENGMQAAVPQEFGLEPTLPGEPSGAIEDTTRVNASEIRTLGVAELLLKNRQRLHRILRDHNVHEALLPRLLAIALTGFVLFGVTMSLVLTVSDRWPSLTAIATVIEAPTQGLISFEAIDSPWGKLGPWVGGQVIVLTAAYAFGLVAASGVALPSLYFYCLLAGVRMSMLEVVVHAVKAKAIAAVALVGILPIYVAMAMGVVIFDIGEFWLRATMWLGLVLPFIAGFWGTVSLYQGFSQMCDTMPADRAVRRECFLRRLVLSWAACYSAIMPVMIYSLWEVFSRT